MKTCSPPKVLKCFEGEGGVRARGSERGSQEGHTGKEGRGGQGQIPPGARKDVFALSARSHGEHSPCNQRTGRQLHFVPHRPRRQNSQTPPLGRSIHI